MTIPVPDHKELRAGTLMSIFGSLDCLAQNSNKVLLTNQSLNQIGFFAGRSSANWLRAQLSIILEEKNGLRTYTR